MSKTYEALKRAEALRAQERANETFDMPWPTPSIPLHGADDYYELRRSLQGSAVGDTLRTVLVVSALHGEGASSVSCVLAKAMADAGRASAMLVDLNLRTPALWRLMNVNGQQGFMNIIGDNKRVEQVAQTTDFDGVSVIAAGTSRLNAVDVVDSEETLRVVGGLSKMADVVFIGGAPVTLYPESRALAPIVDGVILVVEADVTPVGVASRAVDIIRETGANLVGVVLNKTRDYVPERIVRLLG